MKLMKRMRWTCCREESFGSRRMWFCGMKEVCAPQPQAFYFWKRDAFFKLLSVAARSFSDSHGLYQRFGWYWGAQFTAACMFCAYRLEKETSGGDREWCGKSRGTRRWRRHLRWFKEPTSGCMRGYIWIPSVSKVSRPNERCESQSPRPPAALTRQTRQTWDFLHH